MHEKVAAAFGQQVTMELESSVSYLQMAIHFSSRNLDGMSQWMRTQAEEERSHALRFLDHLIDRGQSPQIGSIPAPVAKFADPQAVFAAALKQEQKVTEAIHELHRLTVDKGDLASLPFLLEFVAEQTEEEAMVEGILERIRMAGDDPSALLILDRELGSRTA